MAPPIPTTEPASFAAGDTVRWTRALGDYPPGENWTATYSLRGPSRLDVTATPGTTDYAVTIPAADSGALQPGRYEWVLRVARSGEVYTADRGTITVGANLAMAAAGDRVRHAERMVSLCEQALEGALPDAMKSYQIAGRAVESWSPAELYALRARYAAEVRRLRRRGSPGRNVEVVFGRP